jgi:nicotinate-nucleotide pyrophosphorylase (carboxylating)
MILRTPYDDLSPALVDEIETAGLSPRAVYDHVALAFEEDLPGGGDDVTSAAMPAMGHAVADIVAREPGVVAGLAVAELAFRYALGAEVELSGRRADGTRVLPGEVVLTVAGPVAGVLTAERTALNFASHLSGVATATAAWVDAIAGTGARVLDTRKTLPGWRALQKYAVRCGGGVNHRFSLVDRAMVKDNHAVAAGGVVAAYRAVVAANPGLRVEVEVMDLEELRAVLDAGCTEVLLDNMTAADMREAVLINERAGRPATLEASGGLTIERAREVAETGVDFISVGALTHSVDVFDLGLDFRAAGG